MDKPLRHLPLLSLFLVAIAVAAFAASVSDQNNTQATYIVHVSPAHAPLAAEHPVLTRAYVSLLRSLLPTHLRRPRPSLLYSYGHAATGFAARLTAAQEEHLAGQTPVLAVFPDEVHQLHTTFTPTFLGLSHSNGLLPAAHSASDVVIGVVDTGIYPDRASFAALPSLPPPPASFRGGCVTTPSFNGSAYCNNKLVGAKFFRVGFEAAVGYKLGESNEMSPLDTNGHGTHCASTAAGTAVADASFYGYAPGTAVGVAPAARIAAYKVCWSGCALSDILAGIDAAVSDGVDVISMSIGTASPPPEFHRDSIAIGAFGAVRKGIVVSVSAGNLGPKASTIVNVAPWMLTVGASTVNRAFPVDTVLGDGSTFTGTTLYAGEPLSSAQLPLVSGGDAGSDYCTPGWLIQSRIAGKIVVCKIQKYGDQFKSGVGISKDGGAGAIFINTQARGQEVLPAAHTLPATLVTYADGQRILEYIRSSSTPTATLVFRGTTISPSLAAPKVAAFSSRGPSYRSPEVLKPDVIAPGVNILAAWTGETSPTEVPTDDRRVEFNVISGTSMACPHVSGVAALLHQARSDWSPSAIKSAIMTTAYNVDSSGKTIADLVTGKESTLFERGAGHVNPNAALDPGLVYDAGVDDYISFLCSRHYTASQIALFTRDGSATDCSKYSGSAGDFNYPSFSVIFTYFDKSFTHRRVVRNVGSNADAVYEVNVTGPAGVDVTVSPSTLVFDAKHQSLAYEVTFTKNSKSTMANGDYAFGSVVWTDGEHRVTSPVAVTFSNFLVSSI